MYCMYVDGRALNNIQSISAICGRAHLKYYIKTFLCADGSFLINNLNV